MIGTRLNVVLFNSVQYVLVIRNIHHTLRDTRNTNLSKPRHKKKTNVSPIYNVPDCNKYYTGGNLESDSGVLRKDWLLRLRKNGAM